MEECDAILTSPGAPFELQRVVIRDEVQRVFKNAPDASCQLISSPILGSPPWFTVVAKAHAPGVCAVLSLQRLHCV